MVVGLALCRTHCRSKCSLFTTMVTSDSDSGSGPDRFALCLATLLWVVEDSVVAWWESALLIALYLGYTRADPSIHPCEHEC